MASYLHNLDLCILAYQMYHQSVIWPLDPWYEVMAKKGTSRRDNFMRRVHQTAAAIPPAFDPQQYSGPSAIRGWGNSNENLDPVISTYRPLNPRSPAWTMDGGQFLAIQTPGYITDNIKTVEIATYRARPVGPLTAGVDFTTLNTYPNGTDHLIAFEGGTGVVEEADSPVFSIMGFVLMRNRKGGKHDIHVVFRGSRSGSAARALVKAQFQNKGNADWVSDMNLGKIDEPWVSRVGQVCKGFARSVKTCFGTIKASLLRLNEQYGAPETIWVTGHSLGAALAALFTSSVAVGNLGDNLRQAGLHTWPWSRIVCLPYAMPVVGDEDWMRAFDLMVFCRYIWVGKDIVVFGGKGKLLQHVGAGIHFDAPNGAHDNSHETFIIRAAIINYAQRIRTLKPIAPDVANATPWACYTSFPRMLAGNAFSYLVPGADAPNIITVQNLRTVLYRYRFGDEFDRFLDLFREVIQSSSSYKISFRGSKRRERAEKIQTHQAMMQGNVIRSNPDGTAANKDDILNDLDNDLGALVGDKTDRYIGLGLILNVLEKTSFPLNNILTELSNRPNIRACWHFGE